VTEAREAGGYFRGGLPYNRLGRGRRILVEPMTPRELEVLHLICEGLTNREIAERLTVTLNTVKKHGSHIYGKLGVSSRAQAIVRARELIWSDSNRFFTVTPLSNPPA
jgi:ATP/maltotriose-dependent transcriptional regulator MalT